MQLRGGEWGPSLSLTSPVLQRLAQLTAAAGKASRQEQVCWREQKGCLAEERIPTEGPKAGSGTVLPLFPKQNEEVTIPNGSKNWHWG